MISNKKIYWILLNILIFILFIADSFLYYLSIIPCLEDEAECLTKIKLYISQGYKVLYASIILAIILFLIYEKIIHMFHLFYIVATYYIFYLKDHQENLKYHGLINFYGLITFTIICFIVIMILFKLFSLILYKKYKHLAIIIFTFSIVTQKIKNNYDKITICDKWDIGLNKTKINNKSGCKIKKPKTCQLNYLNYFPQFSYQYVLNTFINCKNRNNVEKFT